MLFYNLLAFHTIVYEKMRATQNMHFYSRRSFQGCIKHNV